MKIWKISKENWDNEMSASVTKTDRRDNSANSPDEKISRLPVILSVMIIRLLLNMCLISTAYAMPPYIHDGLGKVSGEAFSNSYYLDNKALLSSQGVDAPGDLLIKHQTDDGLAKASVSGNLNILTILVDFSDKIAQAPAIFFDTLMYVNTNGTVANYYKEVSYNTLTITTVVLPSALGWTRAPQTYAYYVNNQNGLGSYPHNAQKLVEDLVDTVNPLVNFAQFDNDDDGYVDGLVVVHAGPGAEFTASNSDIWSHKWSISPRLKDGVYISAYSMQPEYWSSVGDMTCGVFCHELGHVFGLPDLYDTDYSSEGIGNWSLMAGGSWNGSLGSSPAHLDAWSKIQLGFVTPNTISNDQSGVSIPNVENNPNIFKLWTNGNPAGEYFLIENRQQMGYDSYLPGNGLLIWHIDDNSGTNNNEWWPGSGLDSHYKVALVQADNLWQMEHKTNRGNSGDPFPGSTTNRTFNGSSSPNSNKYNGLATSVSATNISNSGPNMTADLAVGVPQFVEDDGYILPEQAELHQNYPNPFNSNTSISFNLQKAANVEIEIFDVGGRLVKKVFSGYLEAGERAINWNGIDSFGHRVSSGAYFYSLSIGNNRLYRKMLYLK